MALSLSYTLSEKFCLPIFEDSSLVLECTFKQELTDISDSHRIVITITQIEAAYQSDRTDFVFQMEWDIFACLGEAFKLERCRKTLTG